MPRPSEKRIVSTDSTPPSQTPSRCSPRSVCHCHRTAGAADQRLPWWLLAPRSLPIKFLSSCLPPWLETWIPARVTASSALSTPLATRFPSQWSRIPCSKAKAAPTRPEFFKGLMKKQRNSFPKVKVHNLTVHQMRFQRHQSTKSMEDQISLY